MSLKYSEDFFFGKWSSLPGMSWISTKESLLLYFSCFHFCPVNCWRWTFGDLPGAFSYYYPHQTGLNWNFERTLDWHGYECVTWQRAWIMLNKLFPPCLCPGRMWWLNNLWFQKNRYSEYAARKGSLNPYWLTPFDVTSIVPRSFVLGMAMRQFLAMRIIRIASAYAILRLFALYMRA